MISEKILGVSIKQGEKPSKQHLSLMLVCSFYLAQMLIADPPSRKWQRNQKDIGNAGSTTDIKMLWSAMVCVGQL